MDGAPPNVKKKPLVVKVPVEEPAVELPLVEKKAMESESAIKSIEESLVLEIGRAHV